MLPYARRGIVGASMLGLGRAIGETIAVTIVIGDNPILGQSIFGQGHTLAAVIANEFNEAAAEPLHKAALIGGWPGAFRPDPAGQLDRAACRDAQRAPGWSPDRRGGGLGGALWRSLPRDRCVRSAPVVVASTVPRAGFSGWRWRWRSFR